MDVTTSTVGPVTVVTIAGDIDGSTAPIAQEKVLEVVGNGSRIALDLTQVPYMSSAGLRMLLSTYRQVTGAGGRIVLVGVVDEIQDTMSVTGFLKFFTLCDSLDAAVAALNQ